jgi:protein-S-isoprenylcysteine O-methyltransferase Ste14
MAQSLAAIYSLWGIWLLSWIAASAWSAPTVNRPQLGSEFFYRLLTIAGAAALFASPPRWQASWGADSPAGWLLVVIAASGFLFAWWARIHLGKFWSGTVARKADHRVIDTGPYRWVRHPIYSGIILSSYATALAKGTPLAFVGATVMLAGWYAKASLEERFLRDELGREAYDAYASRVPMLIPFLG